MAPTSCWEYFAQISVPFFLLLMCVTTRTGVTLAWRRYCMSFVQYRRSSTYIPCLTILAVLSFHLQPVLLLFDENSESATPVDNLSYRYFIMIVTAHAPFVHSILPHLCTSSSYPLNYRHLLELLANRSLTFYPLTGTFFLPPYRTLHGKVFLDVSIATRMQACNASDKRTVDRRSDRKK